MPLRKIADLPLPHRCQHPEHDPPKMIVLKPGVYEHICPGCGAKKIVTVNPTHYSCRNAERW